MTDTTPPAPRHAIVTGASRGIGRAIAAHLLTAGWAVTGLDRLPADWSHARFTSLEVDLADRAATHALGLALRVPDPPDALVHAAGLLRAQPLGALAADDGERMWRVHVDAAAALADALAPAMAERGTGRIVLVGSRVAQGLPGRSQYAATKAALVAMARSWAGELAARGVTVNVVSPAATRTAMTEDPQRAASAVRLPPIGRLIEPDEIAALVGFLLSPAAAAITGQDIAVCGGASLHR